MKMVVLCGIVWKMKIVWVVKHVIQEHIPVNRPVRIQHLFVIAHYKNVFLVRAMMIVIKIRFVQNIMKKQERNKFV